MDSNPPGPAEMSVEESARMAMQALAVQALTPEALPEPDSADFPSTRDTWLHAQVNESDAGEPAAARHVMTIYAKPLTRYFRGSSFRAMADADELINGFFASRVARPGYLRDWKASGKPLRRWLINGFLFYLREQARARAAPIRLSEDQIDPASMDAQRSFEREWAVALLGRAIERARSACEQRGQSVHWQLFERHHVHGQSYATLFAALSVEPAAAAAMVRTAAAKFRRAVFDELTNDGIPESEVEPEIILLMEALRR